MLNPLLSANLESRILPFGCSHPRPHPKKSVARWSFSLGVVWWPGSLTTQRMSRGRGFFFLGHSRVDGDYMLRHRNDNNRASCCTNSAGSLFGLKLPLDAEKRASYSTEKKGGETESFIRDTSPCIVALITRSNPYVSATRPRKHWRKTFDARRGQH